MVNYEDLEVVYSSDYGKNAWSAKHRDKKDQAQQKRVGQMGIRTRGQSEHDIARNLRKLCGGKFGQMSRPEFNHRVLGTDGTQR